MNTITFEKYRAANRDFTVDWRRDLATGDTVNTSVWTVSPSTDITLGANTANATHASVFVAGGTEGRAYYLTNTVNTSGGRILVKVLTLLILNTPPS